MGVQRHGGEGTRKDDCTGLTEEEEEYARRETLLLRKIFNYPGGSER